MARLPDMVKSLIFWSLCKKKETRYEIFVLHIQNVRLSGVQKIQKVKNDQICHRICAKHLRSGHSASNRRSYGEVLAHYKIEHGRVPYEIMNRKAFFCGFCGFEVKANKPQWIRTFENHIMSCHWGQINL